MMQIKAMEEKYRGQKWSKKVNPDHFVNQVIKIRSIKA